MSWSYRRSINGRERLIGHSDSEADRTALTKQTHVNLLVNRRQADEVDQVHVVFNTGTVEFQDHVADLNAGQLRGRVSCDPGHTGSFRSSEAEPSRLTRSK